MNIENIFKALEFLGALVTATSLSKMPQEDLNKLQEILELPEAKTLSEKKETKQYENEKERQEQQSQEGETEKKEKHEFTDEEIKIIKKYLNQLE